jgi:hypothetical protein
VDLRWRSLSRVRSTRRGLQDWVSRNPASEWLDRGANRVHNFKPPATDEEILASSLQFVRKLSGFTRPSKANQIAFSRAVDQVAKAAHELLDSLVTNAPPRDRQVEASRARARAADRFHASDERRVT